MVLDSYMYEKAQYVPQSLASFAEDLRLIPFGSAQSRELSAYLNVALRYGLKTCCVFTDADFESVWVRELSRGGYKVWDKLVKPALDEAYRASKEKAKSQLPELSKEDDDDREALTQIRRTMAALLDLTEVVLKHGCYELKEGNFRGQLGFAFNGATKVFADLHRLSWDLKWIEQLVTGGRAAAEEIITEFQVKEDRWGLSIDYLAPLEEAWLAEMDPTQTPEAEREVERERRAAVTKANRILYDLLIPEHFAHVRLDDLLVEEVPGHQACSDYARAPEGFLVIHGEFISGLFEIQWAIARYWFVDALESVSVIEWRDLVEDNLMAQNRSLWNCPHLLISSLEPVSLPDGTLADPGYAERLLVYRLEQKLPTVLSFERYSPADANLQGRTVELLKQSNNVVLSRLSQEERESCELFRRES
jgi:hypothetical protein